ncbi:hypothetical protein KGF56_002309 [Candida oxycetoniae]|uniref:Cyclin-like domain-containing protein n=1 Tax=Candida oxycetoniae TaxID=497107 RepID=A0AAI9WY92_9ASCO|nr:uncharacterized protein KGF56_002309 [Candida oxycetoniae]KAI3404893.1 hypothetical protein KGF56_002309 [Candida oxycetoniae]
MANSPDSFLQVRVSESQRKASHYMVQQMEHSAHKESIDEYQLDQLEHLLSVEISTLPCLALIEQQPEIRLSMRPLLLDFLLEVITILNLSRSTFPFTVNLIDRYCSTRIIKKQHYQLLGLTCLWICCKNLDSKHKVPSLDDLSKICVGGYSKGLFMEMEKHILKSLDWVVYSPTCDSFVDLFLNLLTSLDDTNAQIIKTSYHKIKVSAYYLGELFQFYPNIYFDYTSSQVAILATMSSISQLKLPINLMYILQFYNFYSTAPLSIESFQQVFRNIRFLSVPNSLQKKYSHQPIHQRNMPRTPRMAMPRTPGPSPLGNPERKRREELESQSIVVKRRRSCIEEIE